jgi:GH43 family beta-xylosidase
MRLSRLRTLLFSSAVAVLASTSLCTSALAQGPPGTLTNPLLPSGPDPWVTSHDGFYYYTNTTGGGVTIWKTRSIASLGSAERKVVWKAPAGGPYSRDIWAPELHFLRGKWYIYFAGDAGSNQSHRLWVLENPSPDPLQEDWTLKGKVTDPTDKWAIDGTVFENRGKLYMAWSGWEGDVNGTQSIYLAGLKDPWTVAGKRVMISTPTYPWEKVGDLTSSKDPANPPHVDVNEGPAVLLRGDKIFLVYSASGCWTDHYALGMLTASASSNLLKPESWRKSPVPVFWQSPEAQAFGPGHNSFFKSPDGKEDWILYHANPGPNQGCGGRRSPRAQPFTWKPDGMPDFGRPLPIDKPMPKPSGE